MDEFKDPGTRLIAVTNNTPGVAVRVRYLVVCPCGARTGPFTGLIASIEALDSHVLQCPRRTAPEPA
ncbi:hypothetical protein ABH935_005362 [Catenulispora sp. GAS73]